MRQFQYVVTIAHNAIMRWIMDIYIYKMDDDIYL